MTTVALFGKLREHEIEMYRLNEQESSEKNVKNIAMKTRTKKSDEPEEDVVESSYNENLNLLIKWFGKYLKRKGNKGNQKRYNSKEMNQIILLVSLVKIVENIISRWNVQTLNKKKGRVFTEKRRRSPRKDMPT